MNRLLFTVIFSVVGLMPLKAEVSPPAGESLVSPETQVDYAPLKDLLMRQQWRAANEKTGQLILAAAGRERQGWISTEKIGQLACWDLKTIDNLWMEASQGRFGFSAQFPIFLKTGNRPGRLVDIEAYEKFGDAVGWRSPVTTASNSPRQWVVFKENINFSLDAPVGHLPQIRQQYNLTGNRLQYVTLTRRLVECNVVN